MTTFRKCLTMMLIASFLSGCASLGSRSPCDGWKPIRPEARDMQAASSELKHQIAAHNRFGQQHCEWKP